MFRKLLISIVLVFFAVGISSAQAPLAHFDAPANGAVEVSLTPTIRLYTTYKIDSASIPFNRTDSLEKPLLIIPKFIYDSIPHYMYDSSTASFYNVWNNFGKRGTYSNPNDTTLEFTFSSLKMGETYVVIVNNVHVITPGPTVVQVPDSIITIFTTVLPPHSIYYNSLLHETDFLRCSDTIKIGYSRQLDSVNTPSGKLIEFYHLTANPADTTEDTADAIPHYLRDTLDVSSWVAGTDSSSIYAVLSGLTAGDYYEMAYFTSRLTGDSTQNENFIFRLRDRYELTVDAIPSDTADTLPTIPQELLRTGTFYVIHGDSVQLKAPTSLGEFSFWKWSCATDTAFDDKTTLPLVVTKTACDLRDVAISAVYQRTHIDTLTVHTDSGGTAIVQSSTYATLTASTDYTVTRGDFVTLTPKPNSGKVFHHWYCSLSVLNGSTTPVLKLPMEGDITFTPVFTNWTPTANYELHGVIKVIDGSSPTGIAAITTTNPYVDATPTSHPVSMVILDHNYGLRKYTVQKGGSITSVPNPATSVQDLTSVGWTKTVNELSTVHPTIVTFYVEKLEVNLKVEIAMQDGSEPLEDGFLAFDGYGGKYKNPPPYKNWVEVYSNPRGGIAPIVYTPWNATTHPQDGWTLTYKAGQDVTVYARKRDGYEFVGWSNASGYKYPTSPASLTDDHFSFTIPFPASPIKVKAIYKKSFALEAIYLTQDKDFDGTFTENKYDPDPEIGNYGRIQKEVGFTSGDVVVKMDFTDAVDPSSLYNILCVQNWYRIDGDWNKKIWCSNNYTLSNGNKTVTWTLTKNSGGSQYHMTKLQEFTIVISDRVKSSSGDPLDNPRQFLAQTINPDVEWYIDGVDVTHGNDFCAWCASDAGIYLLTTTTYVKDMDENDDCPGGSTSDPGSAACSMSKTVGDGEDYGGWRSFNTILLGKDRVRTNSVIVPVALVMDEDDGLFDFLTQFGAFLVIFGLFVITMGIFAPAAIAALELSTAEGAALMFGTQLLGGLLMEAAEQGWFSTNADYFGAAKWEGWRENWWGAHPSYKSQLSRHCTEDGGDVHVVAKVLIK